jgi:hypothetical protein
MLTATPVAGPLVIEGCQIDGSGITSIQGGVPQAAFFTRSGPIDVVFRNNAVVLPDAAVGANVFSLLQHTDGLDFASNAYRLGGNQLVYQYDTGSGLQTPTLSQWQAFGMDVGSFPLPGLVLTETPPGLGSPLLNAGVDLTTSSDFTGQRLLRRNDIGAFEGPPTRFDEWQHLHFDEAEILAEETGGPGGSLFDDGVPNLMKYALGLPARDHAPAGLFPFSSPITADPSLEFTRSRLPGDLEWALERSSDLNVWTEVSNPALQILTTGTLTESLRVTLPPGTGTRFFRVKVRMR